MAVPGLFGVAESIVPASAGIALVFDWAACRPRIGGAVPLSGDRCSCSPHVRGWPERLPGYCVVPALAGLKAPVKPGAFVVHMNAPPTWMNRPPRAGRLRHDVGMDSRFLGLPFGLDPTYSVREEPSGDGWYVVTPEGGIAHYEDGTGDVRAARGLSRPHADRLADELNAKCGLD